MSSSIIAKGLTCLWFQYGRKSYIASILTKHVFPIDEYIAVDFDISHTHRLISIEPRNTSQRSTGKILKEINPLTSNTFNCNYYTSDYINKYYVLSMYNVTGILHILF